MKNPWIVIGIIVVVLFGGAIWYSGKVADENNVGVTINLHIKGPLMNASSSTPGFEPQTVVRLTEYSDFQCPACAAIEPFVSSLISNYADRIEFEYKHFPLPMHTRAAAAAVAAEAAGQQGKFFEYHDKLYAAQAEWSAATVPKVMFIRYAEELGLDLELFQKHLDSTILKDKVKSEFIEGSKMTDGAGKPLITGTPTFFLDGNKIEFSTIDDFIEQITLALNSTIASSTNVVQPSEGGVHFGI